MHLSVTLTFPQWPSSEGSREAASSVEIIVCSFICWGTGSLVESGVFQEKSVIDFPQGQKLFGLINKGLVPPWMSTRDVFYLCSLLFSCIFCTFSAVRVSESGVCFKHSSCAVTEQECVTIMGQISVPVSPVSRGSGCRWGVWKNRTYKITYKYI